MRIEDTPLTTDELKVIAAQATHPSLSDTAWVNRLRREVESARRAQHLDAFPEHAFHTADAPGVELDAEQAQLALDTAEWLRTLWNVGYMGANSFRSEPRSAFPAVDLEDIRKSSLFARIRQGRHVLPFPPPTRHGTPWHDLLEHRGMTHTVTAEIVRDEQGQPLAAIIEGCPEWHLIDATSAADGEFAVQHQGKGPTYHLSLRGDGSGTLRRQAAILTRSIHLQGHGGFRNYTLEWPSADGQPLFVTLRAATWERAESEAEHWLATTHPELYGRVRFERSEN